MEEKMTQIQFIEQTLGINSQELAKALGVAPVTVTRWEEGSNTPAGLQAEVLNGLHSVAMSIHQGEDKERADVVKGLLILGIGALIFYLLNQKS
jgi:transcriptional regulator with XRE-family HTH domain